MPRQKIEWTDVEIEQFKSLCSIFCSRKEVCLIMKVSEKTLNRLIEEYLHDEIAPDSTDPVTFSDAFDLYSGQGKASIRRKQFEAAMAGDKTMLIWLGKNYLDQSDVVKQTVTETHTKEVPLYMIAQRTAEKRKQAAAG